MVRDIGGQRDLVSQAKDGGHGGLQAEKTERYLFQFRLRRRGMAAKPGLNSQNALECQLRSAGGAIPGHAVQLLREPVRHSAYATMNFSAVR